ncbi:hypothetical protein DWZ83_10960 [Amedibacillus dolichus]|uniref:O-antigen ligase domain-containing protein n=1 Tax=Amedibacillus dolichus TaxID=31971 RepID=A0A415NTT8_9FIRM|nr:hypothetical protein [Amedibacillus dolichus]RHM03846.1 hypothetical protein DWZ83_10960 [Amedibacillus dolichus]
MLGLIVYYFIWTLLSLRNNSIASVFFEAISTSTILLPMAFMLGFDDRIWNILVKKLPYINALLSTMFFIAVVSYLAQYGINWPMNALLSTMFFIAVVSYLAQYGINWPMNASYKGIYSFWITSTYIMTFMLYDEKRKFVCLNLMLIIIASFIIQSRAWLLQSLLLLFIFFIIVGKGNRYIKFLMGVLLIFITILGISCIFPEVTGNLFGRGLEDTRSGQYAVFFAQHSWSDLIGGLGLNATYRYLGNNYYPYFDNQFMFIMFHYGVLPVISWLSVYFSVFKRQRDCDKQSRKIIKAAKFVGGFILLAYLGLSTYYQIELGYNGVIVMILIGNALKRIYKKRVVY